jgi:SAM-dependent methyltransferase
MEPNFFEARSPYFDHPLLTTERTAREVAFILSELALAPGARLLDVGCGFGRHAVMLAQRGFDVSGIDPSAAMIEAASARAAEAGVLVDFHAVPVEAFELDNAFDAAICLFSTLGQITPAGDTRSLIPRVFAALKPSGHFVIEVLQRGPAVRQLKTEDEIPGKTSKMHITRRFDPADNTITEIFSRQAAAGVETFLLQYRLFSQVEVEVELAEAGFSTQAVYDGYTRTALTANSPMMVFTTKKPHA